MKNKNMEITHELCNKYFEENNGDDSPRKRIDRQRKKIEKIGFPINRLKNIKSIKNLVKDFEENMDKIIYGEFFKEENIHIKLLEDIQFYSSFEKKLAINDTRQQLLNFYYDKKRIQEERIITETIIRLSTKIERYRELTTMPESLKLKYDELTEYAIEFTKELNKFLLEITQAYREEKKYLTSIKMPITNLTEFFNNEFRDVILLNIADLFGLGFSTKHQKEDVLEIKESYLQFLNNYIKKLKNIKFLEDTIAKNKINKVSEIERLFCFFLESRIKKQNIEEELIQQEFIENSISMKKIIEEYKSLSPVKHEDYSKFTNGILETEKKYEYLNCKNIKEYNQKNEKVKNLYRCLENSSIVCDVFNLSYVKSVFFICFSKQKINEHRKNISSIVNDIIEYHDMKKTKEVNDFEKNIYLKKIIFINLLIQKLGEEEEKNIEGTDFFKIRFEVQKKVFEVIEEIDKVLYPDIVHELLKKLYFESFHFLKEENKKIKLKQN